MRPWRAVTVAAFILTAVALYLYAAALGALLVPTCREFSASAENLRCRWPTFLKFAAYFLGAAGVGTFAWELCRRKRGAA
jgi:hypothetical protein